MKLHCKLRDYRGRRSLSDIERETKAAGHRVSGGILSQIERGRTLPTDAQIPVLEQVYALPFKEWYASEFVLIAFEPDGDDT